MTRLNKRHRRTLDRIFARPTSGTIKWSDIETLLKALGAELKERQGSRVRILWNGEIQVFHRPHPSSEADKGAVADVRDWLERNRERP